MILGFEVDFAVLEENFRKRNIRALFFETFRETKAFILNEIPLDATVGIGNSLTLKHIKITEALTSHGNTVYDKEYARDKAEAEQLKKKALLTEYYLSGSNAVSEDGRIINIDHSGNRAAALIFGPDRVIIVVGKNKLTKTWQEAVYRAKNTAAPQNAARAGLNPPCAAVGKCVDCLSPEKVCNALLITEGQAKKDRMTLVIVNEDCGF